jgi:hypothetical protein
MAKLLIISLIIVLSFEGLCAQPLRKDSLIKAARADAGNFKLNRKDFKSFRKTRSNSYSDLFKPTKANVSDTTLLTDSVYVNAFRNAAYSKTLKRRTTGHYFLMGGLIYVAITVVATVVLLFVLLGHAAK